MTRFSRHKTSEAGPDAPGGWPPLRAMALLVALHAVISLFGTVPGCLSVDEGIYRWMTKDFAATGSLEVRTGYRAFPSAETTSEFLPPHNGRSVPRYPYLFPLLATPFYKLAGFTGLFVLNNLAFLATVALTYVLARRLYRHEGTARLAASLLVFGTFAWEYSQAAWPHSLASLLVLGAFALAVIGLDQTSSRREVRWAALSGFVGGFAPGVRLDAILILPAVLALLLYHRPWRPKSAVAVLLGSLPGLAILGLTNRAKFGTFRPFSYGEDHTPVGAHTTPAFLIAAATGLILAWVLTRARAKARLRSLGMRSPRAGPVWPWLAAGFVLVVLLAVPSIRQGAGASVRHAYTLIVDLSTHRTRYDEPALRRSPGGGLVYLEAQKTALLQGLPWLAILLFPLTRIVRRGPQCSTLATLSLVPATFIAFEAVLFPDHGGLGLNLRYLVPILPFLSLLGAWSIREMQRALGPGPHARVMIAVAGVTIALLAVLVRFRFRTADTQEFLLLRVPLVLAGTLAAAIVAAFLLRRSPGRRAGSSESRRAGSSAGRLAAGVTGVLLATALGWSAFVALGYDYGHHRRQRVINRDLGRRTVEALPAAGILVTAPYVDPFLAVIERDGATLAFPDNDQFLDFPRLVAFNLAANQQVFAVFRLTQWTDLKRGPLAAYQVTPLASFEEEFDNGPSLRFVGEGSVAPSDPRRRFVLASIGQVPGSR